MAQCNDDVGVAVAIDWGCSDLLEKRLASSELRDWRRLICWAVENCSEAVVGSTLFGLL